MPWRYQTGESALGIAISSANLSPWATKRTRQVVLDSVGLNCDMVQPAVAASKLEMAKFSLTFLTFRKYVVVASTKRSLAIVRAARVMGADERFLKLVCGPL